MGILALKAMAKRPWPKDAKKTHEKCWYEPLAEPAEAMMGLCFTLSLLPNGIYTIPEVSMLG